MKNIQVIFTLLLTLNLLKKSTAVNVNSDAERLYDDLMNGYNPLTRPVVNSSDILILTMGLRLSQLIDVVSK